MASPIQTALPNLADAPWLVRPETRKVLAAVTAEGGVARIVGGTVRNALLGLPVTDIDIATTVEPEHVLRLATAAGLHAIPTGIEHGTVTVIADHHPFEVTTLRVDVETDGRRAKVAFTEDWRIDAERRDFTINALYCDGDGTLHDPVGGFPDITARRVRFIGDADQRIREDYLRILRFFRFHAQYGAGDLDAPSLAACVRGRVGLRGLSAERVRAEFVKLFAAPGAWAALVAMQEHGILVDCLGMAPRPTLLARLIACEGALALPPSSIRRLAALAVAVKEDASRLAKRLRLSNDERRMLLNLVPASHAAAERPSGSEVRSLAYRFGPEATRDRLLLAWAYSGSDETDAAWLQLLTSVARQASPQMPYKGSDILARGIRPGPQVGEVLEAFEAWWIANDFPEDGPRLEVKLDDIIRTVGTRGQ